MSEETKVKKVLVIGSGPDLIGQGGEYEISALAACAVFKEKGIEVVSVNPNPTSLMNEPDQADQIYLEPLSIANLQKIIAREQPQAVLATCGGQTALNLGYFLGRTGVLEQYNLKLLGLSPRIIADCEDRSRFRDLVRRNGLRVPEGETATAVSQGMEIGSRIGFPVVIRAALALEGAGVSIAYNLEELEAFLEKGLAASPINQVAVEEALLGWGEFEIELLVDKTDHLLAVNITEQIDPLGVHSGDSMAVIPAQGLSFEEQQAFLNVAQTMARSLGVVGLINIQLAKDPINGEIKVIEINPRFTANTALASLASGISLARISIELALGGEIKLLLPGTDLLKLVPLEQLAIKLPRFEMSKFPLSDPNLTTTMKSLGTALGFGSNLKEALQKAIRALEIGRFGLGADGFDLDPGKLSLSELKTKLINPHSERLFYLRYALLRGFSIPELQQLCRFNQWFLNELAELLAFEKKITTYALYNLTPEVMRQAKEWGFSDLQLAFLLNTNEQQVHATRLKMGIIPGYPEIKSWEVDSAQGRTVSYSSYQLKENSVLTSTDPIAIIIGGGPSRIGRGNELEYLIAKAVLAFQTQGYQTMVINSNPNGASTGTALLRKLYFEPLTSEELTNIIKREGPKVIWQCTQRLNSVFHQELQESGVKLLGSTPLDWQELLIKSGCNLTQHSAVGAMMVEVECLSDGVTNLNCGFLQQIEALEVHSGDSAVSFPPYALETEIMIKIKENVRTFTPKLRFKGLLRFRYSVLNKELHLQAIEPWEVQNIPFLSKATGRNWLDAAIRVALGEQLEKLQLGDLTPRHTAIKEVVLPFDRFPQADTLLGPEMRATGMVMGMAADFGVAFIKAQLAAGLHLPTAGLIYLSIRDEERRTFIPIFAQLIELGFAILATDETATFLNRHNLPCQTVFGIGEGRPNIIDHLKNGKIHWLISTYTKNQAVDSLIRGTAIQQGVPIITTLAAAQAAVHGFKQYISGEIELKSLQEYNC